MISKRIGVTLVDQAIVSGGNFITGVFLARQLGLGDFGTYVLLYGVVLILQNFQASLVTAPMMALGPQLAGVSRRRYISALFATQFLGALAVTSLAVVLMLLMHSFWPSLLLIDYVAPLGFVAFSFLLNEYFRRLSFLEEREEGVLFIDLVSYSTRAIGLLVLLSYSLVSVQNALWCIGGGFFVSSLLGLRSGLVHSIKDTGINEILTVVRDHWQYGNWLLASNASYWLSNQAVIYLGGALLSTAVVGAIAAVQNLVGVVNLLLTAFQSLIPQKAAHAFREGGALAMGRLLRFETGRWFMALSPLLLVLAMFPGEVLAFVYGDLYSDYYYLVWFYVAYVLAGFLQRPLVIAFTTIKESKRVFISSIVGIVSTLILAYPLVLSYQEKGVVGTLFLVQLLMLIFLVFGWSKRLGRQLC